VTQSNPRTRMLNWTEFKNYDTSLYHVLEEISSQQKKNKKKIKSSPKQADNSKMAAHLFPTKTRRKRLANILMLVMNQACRKGKEKRTLLRLFSYFENQIYLCIKVTVLYCPGANPGVL